jgi:ribosome maturation factor RimP
LIFWGIEVQQGLKDTKILQIFIDKPNGITLDECKDVGRHISIFLDVEDIMPCRYTLEVSSPGVNRRIFNIEQCVGREGSNFKVKLFSPINGRKNFKVLLESVDLAENKLKFEFEKQPLVVAFSDIDKMTLSYNW